MSLIQDTVQSYFPQLLLRRWIKDPSALQHAFEERMTGAVLFADISGFTKLAEQLAAEGAAGTEELIRILNTGFGELIGLVHAHGGDVVKFAGDALLAIWPEKAQSPASTAGEISTEDAREAAARAAAACGLAMSEALSRSAASHGRGLSLRIALGLGPISLMYGGGHGGAWEYFITGEPLVQIARMQRQIAPGELWVTPPAWECLRSRSSGKPQPGGGARLESLDVAPALTPLPPIALPESAESTLQAWLPRAARQRLQAGQTDWLAEMRRLTVLFVNVPALNHHTTLERAQQIMEVLQRVVDRFGGSINKLNVDEKGVSLLAAFGLPPRSHADDPWRGLQAAQALRLELAALGASSGIGIATGRVFCGEVGNAQRREYTVIGDPVNTAARLMQAAMDDLLVDAETAARLQSRYRFEALAPTAMKGKTASILAFRPAEVLAAEPDGNGGGPVGREAEMAVLNRALSALADARTDATLLLRGEVGFGKSQLIAALQAQAQAREIPVLLGEGDPVGRDIPYHAWGPIFQRMLGVKDGEEADPGHVQAYLARELDAEREGHDPAAARGGGSGGAHVRRVGALDAGAAGLDRAAEHLEPARLDRARAGRAGGGTRAGAGGAGDDRGEAAGGGSCAGRALGDHGGVRGTLGGRKRARGRSAGRPADLAGVAAVFAALRDGGIAGLVLARAPGADAGARGEGHACLAAEPAAG